ncbi:phenylacetate--CoA ligase family protein [Dethiobacter alkaliphilus]|uniref:Phenylacetate-coenzyme A ligase n=1 Tax=Dethiobacter alkaliphilus AHT 1 TaxID=555088 RepID=C0GCT9_DETAL|nr:Phenylacetate--CoA ligase [Dethiobacter alkaliphilus AHT 1]MCW3490549.1 phenylacetate--CoA ligase [Dethiobacter alkaliphilus]
MYWNREAECMSRDRLQEVQLKRLKKTVERVYNSVPHYRRVFQAEGIEPGDIQSLDDLSRLPFTVKQDFRDNYPFGLFSVPQNEIVRYHSSSGTTGKPTVVGYTRNDLATWSELMARSLVSAGATRNSVVQNAYGYGLFTGGLGVHYGAELLGAAVIPISGGNTQRQVMVMKDFGTNVLTCTPSYALFIAEVIEEMGLSLDEFKLHAGIFGAEPWSENMRQEIERRLGIRATDIYGLSEIIGPGVAIECEEKCGLHIFEDHFIPEIIDPATGEVLPYGEKGELAITTVTKEALPIIRYRTRDITTLTVEPCLCGRTHVRMAKVTGRSDDMIIVRGVNVFPTQVESVLLEIGETEPHYQLVVTRKGSLDMLEIQVEVSERMFSDKIKRLEELEKKIHSQIDSILGISAKIRLVEPKTIPRSEGKAKRVIDKREL